MILEDKETILEIWLSRQLRVDKDKDRIEPVDVEHLFYKFSSGTENTNGKYLTEGAK